MVRSLGTQGGTERFVYGFAQYLLGTGVPFQVHCMEEREPIDGVAVKQQPLRARLPN